MGITVIGTAGSEAGISLVKEQGVDHVFNHREPNYMDKIKTLYPDGVDIILEANKTMCYFSEVRFLLIESNRLIDACQR